MDNRDIKVSVCCTVYNHEKYLRKCLDGFVMQKTNFAFEVLVNDDNSTDSSADIIREYSEKYPDIIVPVFQKENQYSKGVQIFEDILYPIAKGKYIALCEGDDYWCDENKLQLQYDYMESDPECIMCLHNTIFHYLDGSYKDRLFNDWKNIHILNAEEVFFEWSVHTSSYFIRNEYAVRPDFGKYCVVYDKVIITRLYTVGKLVVLPQVMSVYNFGVENGAVATMQKTVENYKNSTEYMINYYEKLNAETHYKFDEIIKKKIEQQYFVIFLFKSTKIFPNSKNKKEVIETFKSIVSHPYYSEFMKQNKDKNSWLRYLMIRFKYEGYIIYPIWKLAYCLYYGRKKDNKKNK